jgi:nucleoside-diphosphate-sugar epimerase
MKVLFIGGTGNISTAVSRLALQKGWDLCLLNRGSRKLDLPGAKSITADIGKADEAAEALLGHTWDCVVNWVGFVPADVERDIALFKGKTKQYIFISSASAYQKPSVTPFITEETPLENPFWDYSRNKIACERRLAAEPDFPWIVIRPSLTYSETVVPMAIGGWNDYAMIDRVKKGKPVIVHGDGTSLWTITHADDFAKGAIGLIGNPKAAGEAFHITSDEVLTWNQIYTALADACGARPNLIHIPTDFIVKFNSFHVGNLPGDKAGSAIFDNSKIRRFVPDFKAVIPFAEGIRRTVEWFEADPARQTPRENLNQFMDAVIAAYNVAFERNYDEVNMW